MTEQIAVTGLAVMGSNLARNFARNGAQVVVHNRTTAKTDAEATAVVKETLIAQREALSGVSLDEEAINLMKQQRAFQGAACVVSAVDELMQTILAMV